MNGEALTNSAARNLALLVLTLLPASACDVLSPADPTTDPPETIHGNAPSTAEDGSSASGGDVPSTGTEVPATEVDTLFTSSTSGVVSPRRQVIRDETDFATAWGEATGHLVPAEPAPEIDFAAAQVLLVAMGERPTGGYDIAARSLTVDDGMLYVTVEEVAPGADCLTTQALTQPIVVLRVPVTDGVVQFVEKESVLDCS